MTATMSSAVVVAATLAVLAGDAVTRLQRSTVPLPLGQIALSLCLGEVTGLRLRIDAEVFLLLFPSCQKLPTDGLANPIVTTAEIIRDRPSDIAALNVSEICWRMACGD